MGSDNSAVMIIKTMPTPIDSSLWHFFLTTGVSSTISSVSTLDALEVISLLVILVLIFRTSLEELILDLY